MAIQKGYRHVGFSGRISVNRGFRYTAKVTEFEVSRGNTVFFNVPPSPDGIQGGLTKADKVDWVEMVFELTSPPRSMKKTLSILTEISIKQVIGREASKYAIRLVKNLRDRDGNVLHLDFEPQTMHRHVVYLRYGSDGIPTSASVRIESREYTAFTNLYAQALDETLEQVL